MTACKGQDDFGMGETVSTAKLKIHVGSEKCGTIPAFLALLRANSLSGIHFAVMFLLHLCDIIIKLRKGRTI